MTLCLFHVILFPQTKSYCFVFDKSKDMLFSVAQSGANFTRNPSLGGFRVVNRRTAGRRNR